MKIGVMTHWTGRENYGQQLQCWALQQFLMRRGYEPFLIRYAPRPGLPYRIVGKLYHGFSSIFSRPAAPEPPSPGKLARAEQFEIFKRERLRQTRCIYTSPGGMKGEDIDADAYICGSDQVWKFLSLDHYGTPWFLDFARLGIPRVAYSASFGTAKVSEEFLRYIRPLLKKMTRIGVREKSGVDICARAGRPDAVHVLDPVLLLNADDYAPITQMPETDKYAFYYFLSFPGQYPWNECKEFSRARGLRNVFVPVYDRSVFPFQEFEDPSIPQWIGMLQNAEYVFTNSFHGTCFSILFQRDFIFFPFPNPMCERILSLLTMLELDDRIYTPCSGPLEKQMTRPIDWDRVSRKLFELQGYSCRFLDDALGHK